MFTIIIRDLIVNAHIGITEDEKKTPQRVQINVRIELDERVNPEHDDISETVDYNAIVQAIRQLAEQSSFSLLETFAQKIAEFCLSDPRTKGADVRIQKLDLYDNCGGVGIEFYQEKKF